MMIMDLTRIAYTASDGISSKFSSDDVRLKENRTDKAVVFVECILFVGEKDDA
jgi:hypothetical protein